MLGGPAPYGESYDYDDNGNASTSSAHRLKIKGGMTLYYDDVNHKHAVSSTSTNNSYFYDANGNQITRIIAGVSQ